MTMTDTGVTRMIFTDLKDNHNKFWNAWLDGSIVRTEYARVGTPGQPWAKDFGDSYTAQRELEKLVRAKLKKGYTHQHTIADGATIGPARKAKIEIANDGHIETKKLIDFLVERNVHAIEGATSIRMTAAGRLATPLGPVTNEGLDIAQGIVDRMVNIVGAGQRDDAFDRLVNDYMRIVPRDIGRRRTDPWDLFGDMNKLATEQTTLDSLRAVVKDVEQNSDETGVTWKTKLELVDSTTYRFSKVNKFFQANVNRNHKSYGMKLYRMWEMTIESVIEAFESNLGNIKQLWHGTTDSNLLSILKGGLIVPPRSGFAGRIAGRMYGDGIYFSDQSTKSLNYAGSFWGGQGSRRTFMLYNDVAMGREYLARGGFSGGCRPGYDSTFAKASVSGVRNNEMIVYRATQVKPIFLCEFR